MKIAVVHGYYLHDSGSGSYVRQLTQALVREGHDVTLICQERSPELYDFIDSVYLLDESNTVLLESAGPTPPAFAGSCRLVRPNLGGQLLVYVEGPFPGFSAEGVTAFQNATSEMIERYVSANVAALRTVFDRWQPDLVLANHAIMQPFIVSEALAGRAPYTVTVHGSELNFSIKRDERLVPYALSALAGAAAVVAVSQPGRDEVCEWADSHGLELKSCTHVVSPGVDAEIFTPAPSKAEAVEALRREGILPEECELSPEDEIVAFAGRLGWTKGVQHAVAAMSLVAKERPRARLLMAGSGPAPESLNALSRLLENGDVAGAREFAASDESLQSPPEYGPVVPDVAVPQGERRICLLGHLTRDEVARVFAAADVSVVPSVFPEAVGLVSVEALAAGAIPVTSYHSGLTALADMLASELDDPAFRDLVPRTDYTEGLAKLIVHALDTYPTTEPAFRSRLHEIAVTSFSSWESVARRCLELGAGGV